MCQEHARARLVGPGALQPGRPVSARFRPVRSSIRLCGASSVAFLRTAAGVGASPSSVSCPKK